MNDIKTNIVNKFHHHPHKIDFILSYVLKLAIDKTRLVEIELQADKDKLIADNWELKRWFWSFIENAVVLHTDYIEVDKRLLTDFDVNLIVKSLKGYGVEIRI